MKDVQKIYAAVNMADELRGKDQTIPCPVCASHQVESQRQVVVYPTRTLKKGKRILVQTYCQGCQIRVDYQTDYSS